LAALCTNCASLENRSVSVILPTDFGGGLGASQDF
jgi:hypothetical protein